METTDTAASLAAEIAAISARGKSARYPDDLQQRVVLYARRRLMGRSSLTGVAQSLGLPPQRLKAWIERARAHKKGPSPDSSNAAFSLVPIVVDSSVSKSQYAIACDLGDGTRIEVRGDAELWFETLARVRKNA